MSDTSLEQTNAPRSVNETAPGELRLGEIAEPTGFVTPVPKAELEAKIPNPPRGQIRAGTVEHLAARRLLTPLDTEVPEVKQRLSDLRTAITRLVTDFRWDDVSAQDAAEQLISFLNLGSVQQWSPVLIPHIFEIDRTGNLLPVWQNIITREDPSDLPPDANPAETMLGRARRIAILMLGNYKSLDPSDASQPLGFSQPSKKTAKGTYKKPELPQYLGKLATTPDTSIYATQSLIKQGTTAALQALISALKQAEGWAKVDVVEACLKLNQPSLNEILLASGLDRASGLESYIAVPIFRSLALEHYLRGGNEIAPRLSQQAALIFSQVLQDSMKMNLGPDTRPIVFERDLPPLATALFEGTRSTPTWQNVIAVHRLALLLGHYWTDMSRGTLQDARIAEPVHRCLPLMPEIERWMNGPGRDILLQTLTDADAEAFTPCAKILGELRDPRAIAILISKMDATTDLTSREQALQLGYMCDTLGRLGDRRAVQPMLRLLEHIVNIENRTTRPKRRDNLTTGDADIPGSIVYAAVLRSLGQLHDRSAMDLIVRAAHDFDPYVRTEALEALKRIDPSGEDIRSRMIVREALNDPRDTTVRAACQLVIQYRDSDVIPFLQHLPQLRPELAQLAYDTLRQLGQ